VFLARDTELQRFVAIKVPRASRFVDESAIAKFIEEARTAAALNHPGIVTVFDVGGRKTDRVSWSWSICRADRSKTFCPRAAPLHAGC